MTTRYMRSIALICINELRPIDNANKILQMFRQKQVSTEFATINIVGNKKCMQLYLKL